MNKDYLDIKEDKLIWKFCFYGFFKNLKFFEPYLFIYLLSKDLSFLEIGFLYSIREAFKYIFEIPSGIIADNYGKRNELMACFLFYIASFVFFFLGNGFGLISVGMVFFGLGEAFRSGTHKAMIYSYLERRDWFKHKSFVYGRTRSFSLLGSSISAFLSIIFALNIENLNMLFLLSIIPYIVDFFLIKSYPDYLNERRESEISISKFFHLMIRHIRDVVHDFDLVKLILNVSIYDSIFKSLKDYIQPLIQIVLLGGGAIVILNLGEEQTARLYMGMFYGIIYIMNSIASRNVYRLVENADTEYVMNIYYLIFGVLSMAISGALLIDSKVLLILSYAVVFLLYDTRRPLFVDAAGDMMDKEERATVFSVESQMRALLVVVLAPLFGMIVDVFSIYTLFVVVGIFSLAMGLWLLKTGR
ncbi:Major Facilitator Superfamily protein [Dethiosulfatibacter aminovorans DSM 17477]|uniref:Major Facilitator Superfamily protein n=1 Tax=Dethiosulfatibacter aminovorans DSM 17477 TaxID=1121476 RepID=A0A1M6L930_9FIRM|nr:MFS transporter [Dethiosulfatibacter aminovorans]SHJ67675.1 Major Facilitator Superfamily protein [Dethiosulfatibacter aminovorans DSM 17477]